jgi:general secretion pathway protein G
MSPPTANAEQERDNFPCPHPTLPLQPQPCGASGNWPNVVTGLGTVILFVWIMSPISLSGPGNSAKMPAAMTQIATFKTALDAFQVDNGFYPTGRDGLQALIKQPAGTTNWHGPYLSGDSLPRDPWGHHYLFECPGQHNPDSYDISSPGPPRVNAPIANWARAGLKP